MSQLIFSQAKSIYRAAYKQSKILDDPELSESLFNGVVKAKRHEFRQILAIATLLHEDYIEVTGQMTKNWYFITIRPDESKIDFNSFYERVRKYCERKFMKTYTLSFEQKGIEDKDIGKGFHCHIVANTTHRSKGECLRDTKSSFSGIAAENCIDVQTTKNPNEIIDKYLTEYESEDGHKEPTKEADTKWRASEQLESKYTTVPPRATPLSIKSKTGAIIVELS